MKIWLQRLWRLQSMTPGMDLFPMVVETLQDFGLNIMLDDWEKLPLVGFVGVNANLEPVEKSATTEEDCVADGFAQIIFAVFETVVEIVKVARHKLVEQDVARMIGKLTPPFSKKCLFGLDWRWQYLDQNLDSLQWFDDAELGQPDGKNVAIEMAQIWWVMPKLRCWKEGNRKDDLAQHDETDLQPHTRRKNMAMTRWQKNMPWCCRWLQRRIHGWLKLEKCHWFFQEVKIDHWWLFWSYPPRKCGGRWRIFHDGKIPWESWTDRCVRISCPDCEDLSSMWWVVKMKIWVMLSPILCHVCQVLCHTICPSFTNFVPAFAWTLGGDHGKLVKSWSVSILKKPFLCRSVHTVMVRQSSSGSWPVRISCPDCNLSLML